MKLREITEFFEKIAPLDLQEDYDNAGLLLGNPEMVVTAALCTLDSTEEVLDEAIEHNCNLVIAHHPIIFQGIKKFSNYYVHRVVQKAIKNDIAIYSIHTNLDNILINGVNEHMAKTLNLEEISVLRPKFSSSINSPIGSGIIGVLPQVMTEISFLDLLKRNFACKAVKHTRLIGKSIKTVACCGGSGSFLLGDAMSLKADVFVSSDFKYHEYFDADGQIIIADIGHYETEHLTKKLLYRLLIEKFPTFAARISEVETNPVFYH